jgi:hypothetical protein
VTLATEQKLGRLSVAKMADVAYAICGYQDRRTTLGFLREFLPPDAEAIEQAIAGVDFVANSMQRHAEARAKAEAEQQVRIDSTWQEAIDGMPTDAPLGERSMAEKFRIWWRALLPEGQIEMQRHIYFKHRTLEERRAFLQSAIQGSTSVGTTTRGDSNWLARHIEQPTVYEVQ